MQEQAISGFWSWATKEGGALVGVLLVVLLFMLYIWHRHKVDVAASLEKQKRELAAEERRAQERREAQERGHRVATEITQTHKESCTVIAEGVKEGTHMQHDALSKLAGAVEKNSEKTGDLTVAIREHMARMHADERRRS